MAYLKSLGSLSAACSLLTFATLDPAIAQTSPVEGAASSDAGSSHASPAADRSLGTAPGSSSEAGSTILPAAGEIIVTANKREQKLNDVGITVAVLGGEEFKSRQINNLQDLAQAVPGLSYANSPNGTPIYTLRGVGFNESSLAAYPTVSVYLDQAPLPFGALARHSAFDLERVEVLKGPQGTLFGENSTGGAINYIAAKPTSTAQAGVNLTYGRFNQVIGEAYVSGPITDTLKARISGRIERQDDWQISNSRPGDGNGRVRNYMGRLIVDYTPTDAVRLSLNVNGWRDKSQTQAPQFIAILPQAALINPGLTPASFSPGNARAADWTPGVPRANNSLWQAALRGDMDVTNDITLTSLTSYIDYKQKQGDDGDGLPLEVLDLLSDQGHIKTFSQELRISNNPHSRLRWVVGGNVERSTVDQSAFVSYADSSSNATLGTFLGYPIRGDSYYSDQKMRNYAGFANAEFDITHQLTIKGGARYTNAKTTNVGCSEDSSGEPRGTGPFVYDEVLGGAFGPYVKGNCYPVNNLGYALGGVAPGAPGLYVDSLHEHNVSWKVGLDYKVRPAVLLYANVSKGYKGGGFPTISATTFSQMSPYVQESVLAYEGGFKATLIDRTLQFNAAGFYYDYRNKQLRSKIDAPPYGLLDILQNVPKSTIKGFELELTARPSRSLTITSAFTYIQSTIDRFSGINASGLVANFAGTRIPFTPKYQVGVNADYSVPLTESLVGFAGASINYRSNTTSIIGGDVNPHTVTPQGQSVFRINDYALVDARIGIKTASDKWRVTVFGKNIFNKYYWNNVVTAFDSVVRYAGMPATYGVEVGYKF